MPDPTYNIPDNPEYKPEIRALQDSDPARASTVFNPLIERLIENTHAVRREAAENSGAAYTAEILTSGWHSGAIQPDGTCWFEYEVANAKITEGAIIFAYPGDDASANIIKTCVRCCIDTAEGLLKLYANVIPPADFSILYTVNKGGN